MEPLGGVGKTISHHLPSSIASMNERVGGGCQRAPTDASGFAGAQPRLAKIAQYIAIFRLAAVALYLPTV